MFQALRALGALYHNPQETPQSIRWAREGYRQSTTSLANICRCDSSVWLDPKWSAVPGCFSRMACLDVEARLHSLSDAATNPCRLGESTDPDRSHQTMKVTIIQCEHAQRLWVQYQTCTNNRWMDTVYKQLQASADLNSSIWSFVQ